MVVPSTFDSGAELRFTTAATGAFGIALLTLGAALTALACYGSRSWAFSAEHIFFPAVLACLIGFLNVPYCFIASTRFLWNEPAMATTIGSAAAAGIYTALYIFARRRVSRAAKDNPADRIDLLRRPSISSTTPSYHTQNYFNNHVANMYPTARVAPSTVAITPPVEEPVNEEEAQRRHMSALLHKPEPYISPAASPFNRIEFNVDDTTSPINGYYAPNGPAALSTQSLENPSWRTHNGSWVTNDSRRNSSREDRRREIEMGR